MLPQPRDRTARTVALVPAALAAVGVLVLTALATLAARSGSYARELPPASTTAVPPTRPRITAPPRPTPTGDPPPPPPAPPHHLVGTVLAVLLLAGALTVLVLLLRWVLVHRPRRLPQVPLTGRGPEVATAEAVEAALSAVDTALSGMDRADAREAVVQAWLLLGAAAAGAGTPPRPAETATEYGDRLAAVYALPPAAVHRLAGLYREARFSEHPVRPDQRDAARAELVRLRAALSAAAAHR